MKKQKFMKLSAFTSEPALENAFAAPGSHNGEISVVFRGKNVSIHGWDGSAWTTIYTWNSLDKQFTFENTYQNYFLKSLTGQEETMSVSFFSVDNYQGSTPLMAGIQRDVKLYDIEEVPVYTASDVNKFLTVMSDGSLRWLGISESYVVEVLGGGGEQPAGPTGAGTFLEEQPMSTPWFGAGENSTVDNGILTSRRGTAYVTNANMPQIALNATEAVFSMWYNPVSTRLGLYSNSGNPTGRNFSIMQMSTTRLRIYSEIANAVNIDLATPITLNEWHHVVVTVSSNIAYSSSSTKSLTLKIYLDGQEVWSRTGNSTIPVRRNSNDGHHYFGSLNYNGNISDTGTAQFDFVEWVDNVTLTDAQILSMYNNGERGWSVADGAAS